MFLFPGSFCVQASNPSSAMCKTWKRGFIRLYGYDECGFAFSSSCVQNLELLQLRWEPDLSAPVEPRAAEHRHRRSTRPRSCPGLSSGPLTCALSCITRNCAMKCWPKDYGLSGCTELLVTSGIKTTGITVW